MQIRRMNNMIKVNNKMLKKFLEIMEKYDECVFGDDEEIKEQLEICLNIQGYCSGCEIKVYYDEEEKDFFVENKWC